MLKLKPRNPAKMANLANSVKEKVMISSFQTDILE
jgi:hypothetical protein